MRSIKTANLFKNKFKNIYLSGIGYDKNKFINLSPKFKQIYLSKNKNIFLWYLKNIYFFRKKKISMINVHSVGALPLGVILKLINSSILIYDAHELESETNNKSKFYKFIAKLIEYFFIKFVDHTFVVSASISKWYRRKYNLKKLNVILNAPIYKKIIKKNLFRKKFKIKTEQKIFLYQGGLSKNRGIEEILNVFSKRNCKKSVLVLMGDGPMLKLIHHYSKTYSNIFYHPPVNYNILQKYTSSADFGFSLIKNTCLSHNYCLPNKLFEYCNGAIVPIVSNLKEMKKFVNKYNCGFVINPNEKFINKLVNDIINKQLDEKIKNCNKAIKDNCWQVQENKIIKTYNQIFNANKIL
jgi:hypothetical protein